MWVRVAFDFARVFVFVYVCVHAISLDENIFHRRLTTVPRCRAEFFSAIPTTREDASEHLKHKSNLTNGECLDRAHPNHRPQ